MAFLAQLALGCSIVAMGAVGQARPNKTIRYKIVESEVRVGSETEREMLGAFEEKLEAQDATAAVRVGSGETRGEGYIIQLWKKDKRIGYHLYYGRYDQAISEHFGKKGADLGGGDFRCTKWEGDTCVETRMDHNKPSELSVGERLGGAAGLGIGGDWKVRFPPERNPTVGLTGVIERLEALDAEISDLALSVNAVLARLGALDVLVQSLKKLDLQAVEVRLVGRIEASDEDRAAEHKALGFEHGILRRDVNLHDVAMNQRLDAMEAKLDQTLELLRAEEQEEPTARLLGELEVNGGGGWSYWRKGLAFFEEPIRPASFSLGMRARLELAPGGWERLRIGLESASDFNPASRYTGEVMVADPMGVDAESGGTLSHGVDGGVFVYDVVMRASAQMVWKPRRRRSVQRFGSSIAFGGGMMGVHAHFDEIDGDYSVGDIDGVLSLEVAPLKAYWRYLMVSGRFLYRVVPYVKKNEREVHVFSFGIGVGFSAVGGR